MLIKEIEIPVSRIRGAGPSTVKLLEKLAIHTVADLLSYWPREWEDRTQVSPLLQYNLHAKITVLATVIDHEWFGFGRMKTLKLIIEDEYKTRAELVCFNRSFLENSFPIGSKVLVYGSFYTKYGAIQSSSFDIEKEDQSKALILPVYSLTAGLTQGQLRKLIVNALHAYALGIDSDLPESIREKYNIPSKKDILFFMHKPQNLGETEQGRNALIFEEFFFFEYTIGKRALERSGKLPRLNENNQVSIQKDCLPLSRLQQELVKRLPFLLTKDQVSSLDDINRDLLSTTAMARLLQGDVGSGKTLVSFLACLPVIEQKGQCAILAPTELLARQHAENAALLLEPLGIKIAFLTGTIGARGRTQLLHELKKGSIDIVIGTHALFSKDVEYQNLRLVIIDEQHRFGVLQRSSIIEKGKSSSIENKAPHLLMMSATPIPRTLALSLFGDLDVSIIKTMPQGRKPIITHLAVHGKEQKVYDFIHKELNLGNQVYFVYPLIEDSENLSLKSAQTMFETLQNKIFPDSTIALIHSRISEEEQRSIMINFKKGQIQILVATSIVEVGVDVPNATVMVIEQAERFGLSGLHQLRGRIGRGHKQSYCFLVYSQKLTEDAKARLKVMHSTNDGFLIAEEDLRIRGPGEIIGIQQSGYIAFTIADPIRDAALLEKARIAAFNYIEETANFIKETSKNFSF